MKKSCLIAILLVLTFIFSSTAVAGVVGPRINSVGLSEADNFYSPCAGNDIVNVVADVSGAVAVMANFSAFTGMDCGNGSDTINLVNTAGTTWQGSCNVSAEAASSDFVGGPAVIIAVDGVGGFDFDSSQNIILYNMATPPEREGTCDRFGSSTTNMCEVDDFTDVNFVIEIQTNGTCQGEQTGQEMPWSDFKTVVLFNFSSIDMTSEGIGDKLAALGTALSVYITPPGMFGDSYIGVDTSAFAELDTQAAISLYGLPFAVEPAITGDDPGAITVDSYVLNTPYTIEITCEDIAEDVCEEEACTDYCSDPESPACTGCIDSCLDESGDEIIAECEADGEDFTMTVPNADLTFTVTHFSQYNVTDNEAPIVSINSPSSEATVNREYSVSVSANGTGSQISSIKLYVNGELDQELESTDIFSECSNDDNDWTAVTCSLDVAAGSQDDANITVAVTDFGGAAGLSASANVNPVFVDFCGSTITQDLVLEEDLDCSGSSTDGLNPLEDVTIDCNGYSIAGGGQYKGINNRGYSGVTVKNCNIYGFETGIYAINTNGLTITNNNISQNYAALTSGIYLESVYSSAVSDNYVYDNNVGIHLVGAYQNTISSNTVEDNNRPGDYSGYGILLEDSCYGGCEDNYENTLADNIISGHSNAGIYSYYAYDNNITGGEIYENEEGVRLESSTANIKNVNFHDNFDELIPETGLYVDWDSIAHVENGIFINNGDYAIYDQSPRSVYWTITGAAKCINNSVEIADGSITFDGGTLELENCVLTLPDADGSAIIAINDTISSLDFDVQPVTANASTDFNFSESAVSLTLSSDVTTTMAITGETPGSAPTGFTAFKGIDITVDAATGGALVSALIKIYYSDAELTAANIAESSLKIYYYNETAGAWQLEADQGVDTANNYVWVRVTHFSLFGAFGTAPSTPAYYGGGGGGSSYYKKNTTSQITSATTIAPISFPCSDDWICDEWSACENGIQTRQCGFNDYPECTRTAPKPEMQQACSSAKQEAAWKSPGDEQEQSPVSDIIKQGITGAAAGAQYGMSAIAKQLGVGIAVLVVIAGIAVYLLFLKK